MRVVAALLRCTPLLLVVFSNGTVASSQDASVNAKSPAADHLAHFVLTVSLRTQDHAPFAGAAEVRALPSEGDEIVGVPSRAAGEWTFSDLRPGSYTVEALSAGFVTVRRTLEIEAGTNEQTLFLIMKPGSAPVYTVLVPPTPAAGPATAASNVAAPPVASSASAAESPVVRGAASAPASPGASWIPRMTSTSAGSGVGGANCPVDKVVSGASDRMNQLIEDLEKFTATEQVEHFNVDPHGSRGKQESRTFYYVVLITPQSGGNFRLEEYRDGKTDPTQFPAQIATNGLPALALLFHPNLVSDFNFTCSGLGDWHGQPAWQIDFAQRANRPIRIRAYAIKESYYPLALKGRAWIDASTYQVRHLESELMRPIPEIALLQERMNIDYGPVEFQTSQDKLWLPLDAEVYWERHGHRYYRRHSFSDFKIFAVDAAQQIQAPKESYCFKNRSDQEIVGTLVVWPAKGSASREVSIDLTIPSGTSVCRSVGPGKDISLSLDQIDSATFTHNGPDGAIVAEVSLSRGGSVRMHTDRGNPLANAK